MGQDVNVTAADSAVTDEAAMQALAARGYSLIPYEHDGSTFMRLFHGDLKVCTSENAVCALEFVEMMEKLPRFPGQDNTSIVGSQSADLPVH